MKKVVLIAAFVFVSIFAFAQEIDIHGFISQGYMKSDENNYLTKSKKGSFDFSETAINFATDIDDNIRFGLQFFARDLGDQGNNIFKLDWGFADYSVNDNYGYRLGKIKMPSGLYNTVRDIDLLRTEILLPQGVYDEGMRDFINSMSGFSYYRNLYTEKSGNFEFEFLTGTFNVESDSAYMKNVAGSLSNTGLVLSDFNFTLYRQTGASLKYEAPVEGLTLGYSWFGGEGEIVADVDATALGVALGPVVGPPTKAALEASPQTFILDVKQNYTIGFEYLWDEFVFSHERRRLDAYLTVPVVNAEEGMNNLGYYTKLGYRINEKISASIYSSAFYENKDVKKSAGIKGYQIDNCLSFKYDIKDNFSVKLEYHDMEGAAHLYAHLNPTTVKDWNLIALKATVSF